MVAEMLAKEPEVMKEILKSQSKADQKGSPTGSDPSVGDIAYYAPWGNLAILYKDFGYSDGLIILGRLDSGIETLTAFNAGKVTIELDDR